MGRFANGFAGEYILTRISGNVNLLFSMEKSVTEKTQIKKMRNKTEEKIESMDQKKVERVE